jgi:hypothetical protein
VALVPTGALQSQQFAVVLNNIRSMRNAPEHVVREGLEWYQRAHEDAQYHARRAGRGVDVGAGNISALSQQNPWMLNRMQAIQMHDLTPDDLDSLRNEDRSVLRDTPLNYRPTRAILEAHDILTGAAHPRESLRNTGNLVARDEEGNTIKDPATGKATKERHAVKRYNFQHNIEDPNAPDPVTIDTHALKAALGSGRDKDANEVSGLQYPSRYNSFADAFRQVRDDFGDATAGQTQAVAWMHQLHRYPNRQPDPGLKFLGTQWDPREHGLYMPSDLSIYGDRG